MKISFNRLRRSTYASIAIALAGVGLIPALSGSALAYGQVTSRYVKMSSATVSASSTSYEVGFTVFTTGNVQGVVVDFCSNSPIIGDTCTAPGGFSVGTPTVATTGGANTGLGAGWTAATNNSNRTLSLTNGSGGSISNGTAVKFTLSTATNPNTTGTFYARIFTFATTGATATWLGTANGSSTTGIVDAGGVAMSTTALITVTAKVQETLSFCVYTGGSCGTGTGVGLGDTNGVLSSSGQFVDKNTTYSLASNAAGGVTVRFKAPLPTSGSNDINSIGTSATAPVNGTEQFGLCTYKVSGPGALTPVAPYDNGNCSATTQTAGTGSTGGVNSAQFAFDTASAASTYGDDMATMAAEDATVGKVVFVGGSSVTTPAGIYTSPFDFIATGTY